MGPRPAVPQKSLLRWRLHNSQFYGGDGIVAKGVENTIRTVSTIAREGMRATDGEIIRFMIGNASFAKDGEG